MIKASAIAGAAAWTAPVIIDSLASPAAAGTPGPCVKNYYARINFTGCARHRRSRRLCSDNDDDGEQMKK